jgi:hypothetical protein
MNILLKKIFPVLCFAIVAFSTGCDEDVLVSTEKTASLQVVNGHSQIQAMDITVQDRPFAEALPLGIATGYRSVEAGILQNIQINSAGTRIGEQSYTFAQNGHYTVFAFNSTGRLTFLPLIDSLKTDPAGKVRFRFAHLDESVEEVEAFLLKEGTTEVIAPFPLSYYNGENSQYAAVEPGVYSFIIREPGSDDDVARLDNIQFSSQKNYTFYTYNSGGVMQLRSLEIPTR